MKLWLTLNDAYPAALTNAGGTVSDIWSVRERGLASAIYATVPFLGPGTWRYALALVARLKPESNFYQRLLMTSCVVIGPIVGGFVVENPRLGWHFTFWLMFIFSSITLVAGYFITPETVSPPVFIYLSRRKYLRPTSNVEWMLHWCSAQRR